MIQNTPNRRATARDAPETSADRRAIGPEFRRRLEELITRSSVSKSEFATRIGVDRSALSQLLSGKDARLPRAETLVSIARAQQVSLDWLLGLSQDDTMATELAAELEIEERAGRHDDSRLIEWRRQAQGAKIRYVPAHMPDLLRMPEVAFHERRGEVEQRIQDVIEIDRESLELLRTPEADTEVCMPRQRLELLARGEGVYFGLSRDIRRRQLDRIALLLDELYPAFRLFLFDERKAFASPYTVFGMNRAALYIGDMYLVLNARQHIHALARHFDGLIRHAEIDARDAAAFVDRL